MNNKYCDLYKQLPDPVIATASASLDLAQIASGSSTLPNTILKKFTHVLSRLKYYTMLPSQPINAGKKQTKPQASVSSSLCICTIRNL